MTAIFFICLHAFPAQTPTANSEGVAGKVIMLKTARDLATGTTKRSFEVQLDWATERLPVLISSTPTRMSFSEQGNPHLEINIGRSMIPPEMTNRHNWVLTVPSDWAPAKPWKCKLEATAVVVDGLIVIPMGRVIDLLNRVKFGPLELARDGKFRCLVTRADRKANRLSLTVRTEIDSGAVDLESFQSWAFMNRLESIAGVTKRGPVGFSIDYQSSNFAEVTYHFPANLAADAVLSLTAIRRLRTQNIILEFKDIPSW